MYQKISTTTLVLAISFTIKAQILQPINLLQTNLSFTKKTETNTVSKSSFGTTLMETKSNATITNTTTVALQTGDSLKVQNRIKKFKTKAEVMGQTMEYDSENPLTSDKEIKEAFSNIIGSGYNFFINKQGKITSIDSLQKLTVQEQTAIPNYSNIAKGMNSEIFMVLTSPKNIGDSWTDTIIAEKMKTISTYKYLKNENDIATIQQESSIEMIGDMEQMGMKMNLNQKGTSTGILKVNTKSGLIINRELTTKLEGTVKTDAAPDLSIYINTTTITKESIEE